MKYNSESFNSHKTLKLVREQSGKTQEEFAKELGITKSDLCNFENKTTKRGIGINNYVEWCDRLDCDINYFLGVAAEPTDVCGITGLNPDVVDILKKEKEKPIASEIRNDKDGVISGITTADLLNELFGRKGIFLKEGMLQYVREKMILKLLEESVKNIVEHHNANNNRNDSFSSVVMFADKTMSSIRLISSLSSLTKTGRMQKGIDDDYTVFCDKFGIEGYDKLDSKVIFDYMQSRSRVEALKMKCYDLMMQFLDEMSEDGQLKYHSNIFGGEFDVTASVLYEESIEDIEHSQNEVLEATARREITKLKSRIAEMKKTQQNLIDGNNQLSAELNDERQKVNELQKIIDSIPDEKLTMTELNNENEGLRESVSVLFEANERLDEKVKELEKQLKKHKSVIE